MNRDKVYIEDLLDSDVEYNRFTKDNQKIQLFCLHSFYKLLKGNKELYAGSDCKEAIMLYNGC